jgi:hypothetical protein
MADNDLDVPVLMEGCDCDGDWGGSLELADGRLYMTRARVEVVRELATPHINLELERARRLGILP